MRDPVGTGFALASPRSSRLVHVEDPGARRLRARFFIVDALICVVVIVGRASPSADRARPQALRDRAARRSLIVGAGRTGRSLMRELRETAGERVVGFVDDNPRLRRRRVHGSP